MGGAILRFDVGLAALLVVCAACGGGGEEAGDDAGSGAQVAGATARAPSAGAGGAAPLEVDAATLRSLFPEREMPVSDAVRENLGLRDPEDDGWELEVQAQRAEEALARLVAARSTASGGADPSAAPDALAALDGLLAPIAPDGATRSHVEVTRIEPVSGDGFSTRARLDLWRVPGGERGPADARIAPASEGVPAAGGFHLTLELACTWQDGDEDLRLLELARAADPGELARADAPLFVDRTTHGFGQPEGFPEELVRNPEAYFFHDDRLTEYDLLGNWGVAVGDVDDDGLEDVYVCMPPGVPNRLYLRAPDGGSREAAQELKLAILDGTRSALILDFDGDGRRDVACAVGADVYVSWNIEGRFGRRTLLKSPDAGLAFGLSAADADQDGDLDLFVNRYSLAGVMRGVPTPYHDAFNGASNRYWRNEGERRFVDVTEEVGLDEQNTKFSFSSLWEDLDEDGDLDLYVTNDFGRNHHYLNEGGRFRDVATEVGSEDMAAGMGPSAGDVDGDGDVDLYVSNIYSPEGLRMTSGVRPFLLELPPEELPRYHRHARGNTLLVNEDGRFRDVTLERAVNRGGWAWGARMLDVDNDGDLDVYVPSGFLTTSAERETDELFWRFVVARSPLDPTRTEAYRAAWMTIQYVSFEQGDSWSGAERNVLFLNDGGGSFVDASGVSGADLLQDGRSVAALDWDRDGFEDLVLKSRDAPRVRLLRNQGASAPNAGWMVLELVGAGANRDAIGARVLLRAGERLLRRAVIAGDGFLAQSSRRLHFGLGDEERIDSVEVRWPDGSVEQWETGFEPRHAYRLVQGEGAPRPLEWTPIGRTAADDRPPPRQLGGTNGRVVLCEKLPMAAMPLPRFAGPDERVSDAAGSPLLITLWSSRDEASSEQVRALAEARERLQAAGLRLAPRTPDQGSDLAQARRTAEGLGLGDVWGAVDGWNFEVYELLLMEVFHRLDTNPLPTSLLLDAAGQLCVVYHGPLRVETLLADLELLAKMKPELPTCARLQHGLWLDAPRREYQALVGALDHFGYDELARFYREVAARGR